jgi:hypothetical protein
MNNEARTAVNPFVEVMKKRTDAGLIEILTLRSQDYQPLAVEAALTELKIRNLTKAEIHFAQDELEKKRNDLLIVANKPLSWPLKAVFIFLPGYIRVLFLHVINSRKGTN